MNKLTCAGLLAVAVALGCGDDSSDSPGDGDGGAGGDDGSAGGAGGAAGSEEGPAIAFTVVVLDASQVEDTPIPGLEICAAGRDDIPCATADADGRVELQLPSHSEVMLRCESADFGPMAMTWAIGASDIDAGTFRILDKTRIDILFTVSGAEQWPAQGGVLVNVFDDLIERDTRVAGASFTIATTAGGPVYVSEAMFPDPELEASTAGGPGLFFDIAGGEVTLAIGHPTRACVGGFGWPGASDAELRSRIFPGVLSSVTFVCPR